MDGSDQARAQAQAQLGGAPQACGPAAGSRAAVFLKASAFDFMLVLVLATALTYTVSYGFYGAEQLRGNFVLEAALACPLLLCLFAGSWSKRALLPAAAGCVGVSAALLGGAAALMPAGTAFMSGLALNDVPENYMVGVLVLVACTALSYLLSRRVALLAVLAALSVAACGMIQFLYRDWMTEHNGLAAALAVFASVTALFVYQRYRCAAMGTARMSSQPFGAVFGLGVGISAGCMLLALGLFFAIIAPLGLSTPQLKPFNDYYQRPLVEYSGPMDTQKVEDPNKLSSNAGSETSATNQSAPGGAAPQELPVGASSSAESSASELLSAYDENNPQEQYDSIGYELVQQALSIGAVVALLALLAVVALRIWWRGYRLRRMAGRSRAYQVVSLYEFLCSRFPKLGVEYAPTLTPLAFAFASTAKLAPYARNKRGVDFVQVTLVYQRAAYGSREISQEEYDDVVEYYRAFFGNARRTLGLRRWLFFKFWTV